MSDTGSLAGLGTTALFVMLLLGAYHGINPAMGWLFAVALGIQERSSAAVGRSLLPIALGHGLAIGAVVLFAVLLGTCALALNSLTAALQRVMLTANPWGINSFPCHLRLVEMSAVESAVTPSHS